MDNEMYDKDDMEHCPVCGENRVIIGRDFNTTSFRSLGHTWHQCLKHKCVALGKPHKVGTIGDCTCPDMVEISEKIPEPFIKSEYILDAISLNIVDQFAHDICSVQPMTKKTKDLFFWKYECPMTDEEINHYWFQDSPIEKTEDYRYEEISRSSFDLLTHHDAEEKIVITKHLQKEDIICIYQSPDWTWGALCGRAGVCVIRDDGIVALYCLAMS